MKKNKLIVFGMAAAFFCSVFFGVNVRAEEAHEAAAVETEDMAEESDFSYEEEENGELTIWGYLGNAAEITIPAEIAGKKVRSVYFHDEDDSLTSITVSEGIESISFVDQNSLETIFLPASVGHIWVNHCSNLKSIAIDSSNTHYVVQDDIVYNAEQTELIVCPGTKAGKVIIPEGVEKIGSYAFSGCSSLTDITIPASVQIIESYALFSGCSSLTNITVAADNEYYASQDGILYDAEKTTLIRCPVGKSGAISIPEGVTGTEPEAFTNCGELTGIAIPKSLKFFDYDYGNGYQGVFSGCVKLENITVEDGNANYIVRDGMLYGEWNKRLYFCPRSKSGNISVSQGTESIAEYAFADCKNITGIQFPVSLKWIDKEAFKNCGKLTGITFPEGMVSLGSYAFENCNGLTDVTIPLSVVRIDEAFEGCSSLKEATIKGNISFYGAFSGCSSDLVLNVISGSRAEQDAIACGIEYHSVPGELDHYIYRKEYDNSPGLTVVGYDGTDTDLVIPSEYAGNKIVGVFGFRDNQTVRSIKADIPIYQSSFGNCGNLTSVELTEGCTGLGRFVFDDCPSLREVTIPPSVKGIESSFRNCSSDLTFYVTAGSDGEAYAKSRGIKYIIISGGESSCTHEWKSVVVPAKVNADGSIQMKCGKCKEVQSTTAIAAPAVLSLSKTSEKYNGKKKKLVVTVKDRSQKELSPQTDYTVIYPKEMKNVGKYVIAVQLKGNYSGVMEQEFTIVPKSTSITKLTPNPKGISVKWKKQTTQTTGYEISCSTDKKFKKDVSKSVTIKKNKTMQTTLKKLKPKKKYYVRIRTYKKAGRTKIYSTWSKPKSVKTK